MKREGEQRVPGLLRDDPDRQAVSRIRSGEAVEDELIPAAQMVPHLRVEPVERRLVRRDVELAPPDLVVDARGVDDEAVARRAPGPVSGPDAQRAVRGESALAARDRLLDETGRRQVPVDLARRGDSRWGRLRRHVRCSFARRL